MPRRRQLLFFGACLFFGSLFVMISQLYTPSYAVKQKSERGVSFEVDEVYKRIQRMEEDLEKNKNLISEVSVMT